MSFSIAFDYRFDRSGFFDDTVRRAALEEAAAQWSSFIRDEFEDLPAGISFDLRDPSGQGTRTVTLTDPVDDILIFVGAGLLDGAILALAGPNGGTAAGDVLAARISPDFRGTGAVTDFEPWVGVITFDIDARWHFGLGPPDPGQIDFLSVAMHEIGHVLGIGTSGTFDRWIIDDAFTGPNALRINQGAPIPLSEDHAHVEDGFWDDLVSLDPILTTGTRVLISDHDKALLADIGYEIDGFLKLGETPPIATPGSERIFGRDVADGIDGLAGDDSLQGGAGDDLLSGNLGNDDLFGQAGDDTLEGGPGDDYLDGGIGDDVLRGGPGTDRMYGNGGRDTFVIAAGDGHTRVFDFETDRETLRLIDSGFASAQQVLDAITRPFSNVSRISFSDGTMLDVSHAMQGGSPLVAAHFDLVTTSASPPPREIVTDRPVSVSESVLNGTQGDDPALIATRGLDLIDGQGGVDTVLFAGEQARYLLRLGPDGVAITDRGDPGLGTILLDNIELIDFGTPIDMFGGPLDLRSFAGHAGLDRETLDGLIEMYIAYFNRAPDAVGLSFWSTAHANGLSLEEVAEGFADQPETRALYPQDSRNILFVHEVYQNVLGRAPDMDGLRFWSHALDDGELSRGTFILEMLRGAKADPPEGASQVFVDRQLADRDYLDQKTELGALYAVHHGMSNTDDASRVLSLFDGSTDSFRTTVAAIETLYDAAMDPLEGDFLMQLVGVLDDPLLS
ncbi:MAG: DUF4214 domain-containing protein [Pelagibaca sp.]